MSQFPPIIFSHMTALQIARAFSDAGLGECVGSRAGRGSILKPSRIKYASRTPVSVLSMASFFEDVPCLSDIAAKGCSAAPFQEEGAAAAPFCSGDSVSIAVPACDESVSSGFYLSSVADAFYQAGHGDPSLASVRLGDFRAMLSKPLHFITASKSQCRREGIAKPHLFTRRLPSNSVLKISEGYYACSPEFAFLQMAFQRKEMVFLLELGYELCGTYQALIAGSFGDYGVTPLMTAASLRGFVEKNPSLPGAHAVRRILPFLTDGSASMRETKLALLLGLPRRFGGYGLGTPVMNYSVSANEQAQRIAQRRSFRCDVCWPDCKIDVEYQSRLVHSGEAARIRDSRRTNALVSMGWTVIGVTNEELESSSACDAIAEAVRRASGKQRRYSPENFKQRNEELRWELGLP